MSIARLLVLMGSGETSPTMVKTHKELLARLGPPPVPAVVLDTPFGFQANADELTARAQAYFRESVNQSLDVVSFRHEREVGTIAYETALTRLAEARYVFAGPGSPTYALRTWQSSRLPALLDEKLAAGGCVTFASAAALTLGAVTVPVYEIYKVGTTPAWEPGLDLVRRAGLNAAVIPHYNNAEGGTHDTRFCYLGEARLSFLEQSLPPDAFVLGIDEHTGLILDLDAASAVVTGIGVVTVRVGGRSETIASGTTLPIADIKAIVNRLRAGEGASPAAPVVQTPERGAPAVGHDAGASPLLAQMETRESAFAAALAARDVPAAVQAILDLEGELHAWSSETFSSDEMDRARAALRSMVVRLGEVAVGGARDPRHVLGPFVEAMLGLRAAARADKRFADADAVRDSLVGLGVEVRDSPAGTEWELPS